MERAILVPVFHFLGISKARLLRLVCMEWKECANQLFDRVRINESAFCSMLHECEREICRCRAEYRSSTTPTGRRECQSGCSRKKMEVFLLRKKARCCESGKGSPRRWCRDLSRWLEASDEKKTGILRRNAGITNFLEHAAKRFLQPSKIADRIFMKELFDGRVWEGLISSESVENPDSLFLQFAFECSGIVNDYRPIYDQVIIYESGKRKFITLVFDAHSLTVVEEADNHWYANAKVKLFCSIYAQFVTLCGLQEKMRPLFEYSIRRLDLHNIKKGLVTIPNGHTDHVDRRDLITSPPVIMQIAFGTGSEEEKTHRILEKAYEDASRYKYKHHFGYAWHNLEV